jgi:hypothetical protein
MLLQQGLQRVQALAAGLSAAEQRLQQQAAEVAAAAAAVQREQTYQQQVARDKLGSLCFNVGGTRFEVGRERFALTVSGSSKQRSMMYPRCCTTRRQAATAGACCSTLLAHLMCVRHFFTSVHCWGVCRLACPRCCTTMPPGTYIFVSALLPHVVPTAAHILAN